MVQLRYDLRSFPILGGYSSSRVIHYGFILRYL